METIKNRKVTLFFVEGIDTESVQKRPLDREEVHEIKWVPVNNYIVETMN